MRGSELGDIDEGVDVLIHGHDIDHDLRDDLFEAVDEATIELVDEAELDDEIDIEIVQEYTKTSFCEYIALADDVGARDVGFYCRRTMTEMTVETCQNTRILLERVADRHSDLMRLSKTITDDTD